MRTRIALLVLELVILGGLAGYLQYRYAQANYPKSWRWQWALFLSGFIAGATGIVTFLYQELAIHELLLFSLLTGMFGGLIFTFLFPHNVRRIYPKRNDGPE